MTTDNTIERKDLQFLGYNLGKYTDWDGDENIMQWYDWSPGPDVKFRPPNSRGNELLLIINTIPGEVEIKDYECPEYVEEGRGWVTLAKLQWKDFIK